MDIVAVEAPAMAWLRIEFELGVTSDVRRIVFLLILVVGLFSLASANGGVHGTVLFPTPASLTPTLSNPVGLAVADIDGDGWTDIVASANNTEKIVWYRNNGNGTYGSVQYTVTTSPSSAAFSNVAVGDIDGDGRPDVVFWSGSSIKWTPNLGGSNPVAQFGYNSGNATANQFIVASTSASETYVGLSDLNGDSRPDVISYSVNPDRSVAWVPNLTSGFGARVVISTAGNEPTSIQGVDLDSDGDKDLLVTSLVDNSVAWFQNSGAGVFGARRVISNGVTFARHAVAADFNGDGRVDVACVGSPFALATVRWFAQGGSVANPTWTQNSVTEIQNGGYTLAARDLNSDGWMDLALAAAGSNKVVWCENLGSGNFGTLTTNQKVVATANNPVALQTGDLDNNGTVDLVANAVNEARVYSYRNLGGQSAMVTADTAPATLVDGRRAAALRIDVSHRGIAGDSPAQLDTLSLRFESSPGVLLDTVKANSLLDKVAVHLDVDSSGTFDPAIDPAVATVTQLSLTNGVLTFPFTGSVPADVQIAPGATRTYFVALKIAESGSIQTPNSVRVSHVSHGNGRSIVRDATTSSVLTVESATISNASSAFITAQPAHTYTDYAHLHFDSSSAPNTGASDDYDFDGNTNLVEFGFGMDPKNNGSPEIVVAGGVLTQRGVPVATATNTGTGVVYQAVFGRRMDALANLSYTVQFSANLTTWVSSTATPAVLGNDGVIEAVAVPYPFFVNGKKARFFRVVVTSP